jgi:hypothetical protein
MQLQDGLGDHRRATPPGSGRPSSGHALPNLRFGNARVTKPAGLITIQIDLAC